MRLEILPTTLSGYIYHDAVSLYDHSEPQLQLPNRSYDLDERIIAILTTGGEYSFEEQARNVVSLFQSQNAVVQYLIVDDDEKSDMASSGQNDEVLMQMSVEPTANLPGKNNDEIVKERLSIVMIFVAHATGNTIIDAASARGR